MLSMTISVLYTTGMNIDQSEKYYDFSSVDTIILLSNVIDHFRWLL